MTERRKESRVREENKVIFEIISGDKIQHGKKIFGALTKDISVGGVKILTDTSLPIDTLLKTKLSLAKTHNLVTVIGKVRWINRLFCDQLFEIGLEFVDTHPDIIMVLIEHIFGKQKKSLKNRKESGKKGRGNRQRKISNRRKARSQDSR